MKRYQLQLQDVEMSDALGEIDRLSGLEPRQRNTLRLLTEEMFSMMQNVLSNQEAGFQIEYEGKSFALTLTANVLVSDKAREEYLSMSKSGKNMANRGILGKVISFLEAMAVGVPTPGPVLYGLSPEISGYAQIWQMSSYMEEAPEKEREVEWDGMEKSIIANFADDVLIGVRDSYMEMVVKKSF